MTYGMETTFAFEAIGTHWKIRIDQELDEKTSSALLCSIKDCIEQFDRVYSRFRPDSIVTEMSVHAGQYQLPKNAGAMMDVYECLYRVTDGRFTPLIGQTISSAGYDANYSLVSKKLMHPPRWEEVMEFHDLILTLKSPVLLDFGAAGKGYLADFVGKILIEEGFTTFVVDAGGDIVCRGTSRIGLEHPMRTDEAIGIVTVTDKSVCGSATNRRAWGEFHHIIDPETLTSPRHLLATWVIADSGLIADALATCLFFSSPEILKTVYDFEYTMLFADGHVEFSPDGAFELF